jgi:hypothetical protein
MLGGLQIISGDSSLRQRSTVAQSLAVTGIKFKALRAASHQGNCLGREVVQQSHSLSQQAVIISLSNSELGCLCPLDVQLERHLESVEL